MPETAGSSAAAKPEGQMPEQDMDLVPGIFDEDEAGRTVLAKHGTLFHMCRLTREGEH